MMKASLAVIIGVLLVSVGVASHGQEPRKIEFRMRPGESVTYASHAETTTEHVSRRARGADSRTIVFKSDMRVLLRCIKVSEDGLVHVEITYPDFTMETAMTEGGRTSKIVTDRDGAKTYLDGKLEEQSTWEVLEKQGSPNLKELFSSIIGFTIDKRGKVVEATAPAELATRLSGIDIKQFFRHQVLFPEVAVVPGAEWSESTEREAPRSPGPLSGKIMIDEASYKYRRNETAMGRECARIQIAATSRPKEKILSLDEFKQANEGWSLVSLEDGQLVSSEMKLFQEMKGSPGGLSTEVKTTGVVRTSLVPTSATEPGSAEKEPPTDSR